MATKTAFVASALPARFLLDNWHKLNVSQIICGSESLKQGFQFLNDKFPEVTILSLPIARKERIGFLLAEVKKSKLSMVIFHECCWLELDIAILKVQPVVEYYPCVTLNSWKKLTPDELSFFPLLLRALVKKNKEILKLLYWSLSLKNNFNFYEVVGDNEGDVNFQTALKESRVESLIKSYKSLDDKYLSKKLRSEKGSKTIVLILATDVVANREQIRIFHLIANVCKKYEYTILIKDHPNPNFRLNFCGVGKIISPLIPIEVFDEPYFMKVGLFSTSLSFDPENSISIANLFSPMQKNFEDRKKHLLSIPGGEKIKFIENLDEFDTILCSSLKNNE